MNKLKFAITLVMCFSLSFAFQTNTDKKTNDTSSTQVNINFPDTIKFKNVSEIKENDFLEKNMPWVAALVIGLASVFVNIWLSNKLRLSNEKNLQKQIESAKDIGMNQFKATIATKNRQEWINELRHSVSQFLSYSALMHPQFEMNSASPTDRSNFYDKLLYSKAKIDLLTNENCSDQKALLDSLMVVIRIVTKGNSNMEDEFVGARNDVVEKSRIVFENHWNKIKALK